MNEFNLGDRLHTDIVYFVVENCGRDEREKRNAIKYETCLRETSKFIVFYRFEIANTQNDLRRFQCFFRSYFLFQGEKSNPSSAQRKRKQKQKQKFHLIYWNGWRPYNAKQNPNEKKYIVFFKIHKCIFTIERAMIALRFWENGVMKSDNSARAESFQIKRKRQ